MNKYIIDANLPKNLTIWLSRRGFDCLHTIDLPMQNRTPDNDIIDLSLEEKRIVITKDVDFVERFLVKRVPYKLLQITTGNLSNTKLIALFEKAFPIIDAEFSKNFFIELSLNEITIHT